MSLLKRRQPHLKTFVPSFLTFLGNYISLSSLRGLIWEIWVKKTLSKSITYLQYFSTPHFQFKIKLA